MEARRRFTRGTRRGTPGAAPGSIVVDPTARASEMHVLAFGPDDLIEKDVGAVSELNELRSQSMVWINVDGLGTTEVLQDLAEEFALHPLALEDVVNVGQRSKVEDYDAVQFIVLRMPGGGRSPHTEQVSLFFGPGFVLSFQEQPGDCLELVRKRLRQGRPRIRSSGSDYLAYALIDAVIDGYFPVLEAYGERLLEFEGRLLSDDTDVSVVQLYDLKRDLLALRAFIRPMREAIGALLRSESELITENTRLFLRDCYDHALQVVDLVEHHQETASGLIELYRSNVQGRLNEVMKVLTVTATIFIPLSFIAGVYGMNFDPGVSPLNMPELGWFWGYPFALTLMALAALGMLFFFRRKGWIGGGQGASTEEESR